MDFRNYLQQEFLRRKNANPRYSIRAFARLLKVENSFLSKMLRGLKPISSDILLKFGSILDLTEGQILNFSRSVQPPKLKSAAHDLSFDSLSAEQFSLISNWHYLALLEMIRLKKFQPDVSWIAKQLNISTKEVETIVSSLNRLQYLQIEGKKWKRIEAPLTTVGTQHTTEAFKFFQRQILDLASKALDDVPFSIRDQSGITLPVRSKDIPAVKEKIKKFRRSILAFVDNKKTEKDFDSVYQLSISFFPLTRVQKIDRER